MLTPFFRLLTELSARKSVSQLTGAIAKSRISKLFIRRFAATYRIAVDEAERPLADYRCLNDFFTRRLKSGARAIDQTADGIVSPVDAVITGMGPIRDGMLLSVKGQDYSLAELLQDESRARQFAAGFFFVLYLSPRDYHRIHVPVSGRIKECKHLPGKVYPVNEFGLRQMKRVLSRNERLITYIEADGQTGTETAVVKVGALNVSSIRYAVEPLPEHVGRGDELAYFEFGSTIVLLLEHPQFVADTRLQTGTAVKMGGLLGLNPSRKGSD
jgi:phosphatidylserine decarboxylase